MGNNFIALFVFVKINVFGLFWVVIVITLSYPGFYSSINTVFDHLVHFSARYPLNLCTIAQATDFMTRMCHAFRVNLPVLRSVS